MTESEVILLVDGQKFKANKNALCEYSDYFRTMFNGKYVENQMQEIPIHGLSALSMEIILQHINTDSTNLADYSFCTLVDIANAANYLQISMLMRPIEYALKLKEVTPANWMEMMEVAKFFPEFAACNMFPLRSMKPEYIPDITGLYWYLSHKHLNVSSEWEVFNFGHMWVTQNKAGDDDAFLIILGCLDVEKLTLYDLTQMKMLMSCIENSLAAKVVNCIHDMIAFGFDFSNLDYSEAKVMVDSYPKAVVDETIQLIKDNQRFSYESLYFYKHKIERGDVKWLQLNTKYKSVIKVLAWGLSKIVIIGITQHADRSEKCLNVYDVLKGKWTYHSISWSWHSQSQAVILEDKLFMITNSSDTFSTTIYNLEDGTHIEDNALVPLGAGTERPPAACAHEGNVYAAGTTQIYKLEDIGNGVWRWSAVVDAGFRPTHMVSFKGCIYCVLDDRLYRFRPNVDNQLDLVTRLPGKIHDICNIGDCLSVYCIRRHPFVNMVRVYESGRQSPCTLAWTFTSDCSVINCVPLVIDPLPLRGVISNYAQKYLKKYDT